MTTKGWAESLQARLGLPKNCREGVLEELAGRKRRSRAAHSPCPAPNSAASITFQQCLLIELLARVKFPAGAYSYQPHNTVNIQNKLQRNTP